MNFKFMTRHWRRATSTDVEMDPEYRNHLIERLLPQQVAYNLLMVSSNGNPQGFEMMNPDRKEWGFVIQDLTKGESSWRLQTFNARGYKGNQSFDSLEEAVESLVTFFPHPDKGALEREMVGSSWGVSLPSIDYKAQFGEKSSLSPRLLKKLCVPIRKGGEHVSGEFA